MTLELLLVAQIALRINSESLQESVGIRQRSKSYRKKTAHNPIVILSKGLLVADADTVT